MIDVRDPLERALLIAAPRKGTRDVSLMDEHLDELARLVDTAGAEVVGRITQQIQSPTPGFLIGEGKVEEVRLACVEKNAYARHFRRGADADAGRQPGARAQGAGHGSRGGHPRHLLHPGQEPRGEAPGGARAARVHAAPPHAHVDPLVAHPGRHRPARSRRNPARDRPADDPQEDPAAAREAARRGTPPHHGARGSRVDAGVPRSWAIPTPASRASCAP